jgi:hypothetical protein
MTVWEWWAELDAKILATRELESKMEEARSGKPKGVLFSDAEWNAAREKHAARMRANT